MGLIHKGEANEWGGYKMDMSQEDNKTAWQGNGTSIFDPVLCELAYTWFNIQGGSILDPFAGGSVRGIVANYLGYKYTGIDLRYEQIEENKKQAEQIIPINKPNWIVGNSLDIPILLKDKEYDFVFSCPPYYDLEIYSDNPNDLSNMDYNSFTQTYKNIIKNSVSKLKDNRFACFVIANVRDKKGFYRDLVSLTINSFEEAGAKFYNDIILVNVVGSLPIRVGRQFSRYRKVGKMHQNVLVFYKGDPKQIKNIYGEIEIDNNLLLEL